MFENIMSLILLASLQEIILDNSKEENDVKINSFYEYKEKQISNIKRRGALSYSKVLDINEMKIDGII